MSTPASGTISPSLPDTEGLRKDAPCPFPSLPTSVLPPSPLHALLISPCCHVLAILITRGALARNAFFIRTECTLLATRNTSP